MTSAALLDSPPAIAWVRALRDPISTLQWTLAEWERVIRVARRLRLLARLAEQLLANDLLDQVPLPARRHLLSEQRLSRWRLATMEWAVERIGLALAPGGYPLVLLKGAAYLGQGLAIAAGRLPSDLDILVPKDCIAGAQATLQAEGWTSVEMDAHDQRYYDEWSHEVPPMRHAVHGVELDLHHNILPPVGRPSVAAEKLLARVQPSSRWPTWQVLSPTDQILHSAAHLFHDSDVRDRLRDLVDLDGLITAFGKTPNFWDQLDNRAADLGLTESLSLACYFLRHWMGTPVPLDSAQQRQSTGLSAWQRAWLLPVLRTLLMPAEPDSPPGYRQATAATLFAIRYHHRRLPLRFLAPHLWHKLRIARPA